MDWIAWLTKSPFKRHLVSQLGRPRGPLGRAVARAMNRSNLKLSRHALAGLDLKAGEMALEVGFGGGVALPLILDAVGIHGQVFGLDRAPTMLALARQVFGAEVATGRLRLVEAELPLWPGGLPLFDGILAVNVVYFWSQPQACVNALAAALKPGGRLSLGLRPPEAAKASGLEKAGFNTVEPEAVLEWLRVAGLQDARLSPLSEGNYLAQAAMARKPI
jgi:arsenite methyltransferase